MLFMRSCLGGRALRAGLWGEPNARLYRSRSVLYPLAWRAGPAGSDPAYSTRVSGGLVHFPFKASVFGEYRRRISMNSLDGAGSQLDSFAASGGSRCTYSVSPPLASFFRLESIGELIK